MSMQIAVEVAPGMADQLTIEQGLQAHDAVALPPARPEPLWVIARDDAGSVQGGLRGSTMWGWLYVDQLWVAESARRRGIGGQLLAAAEQTARERGCVGVHVHTFTSQAPAFYLKRDYREAGRIADLPAGQDWIWLEKPLAS